MQEVAKGYMSFIEGFFLKHPEYKGGSREIDWCKAKEFIEGNKSKITSVSAGLAEDWSCTSGEVWNSTQGYIPQDETYVYGASYWATPSIEVEFNDGETKMFECWKLGDNEKDYFKEEDQCQNL